MMIVYVSPHYDDICFSLGCTVSEIRQGILLNVFTQTAYAKDHVLRDIGSEDKIAAVSRIRSAEDKVFSDQFDLIQKNLELPDAGISRDPFDLEGIEADIKQLEEQLIPTLVEYLNSKKDNVIFSPLAIGKHRNHVSTFEVIARNYNTLSHYGDIIFYEDVPYSSYSEKREARLVEVSDFLKGHHYVRKEKVITGESAVKKIEMIRIYKSQLTQNIPISIDKYTIDIKGSLQKHEALWVSSDKSKSLRDRLHL